MYLHPFALGSKGGNTEINVTARGGLSSVLEPDGDFVWEMNVVGTETVEERRLDALVDHADVVKLDLQGYEREALRGSTGLLDDVSIILCEISFRRTYEDQALFCDIADQVANYGFDLYMLYNIYNVSNERGGITGGDALFVDRTIWN